MNYVDAKIAYLRKQLPILIAGAVGGVFCVFCDYFIKNNESIISKMFEMMSADFNIPAIAGFMILAVLLPLLSVGLCFVFEPDRKSTAFYMGASVLAFAFNFIPVDFDQLKAHPNSAKISVSLSVPVEAKIGGVTVTVREESDKTIGRSKYKERAFYFYLDKGSYDMRIEVPGYEIIEQQIEVLNDDDQKFGFTLVPSVIPTVIQKLMI